jgi:hypothetical protein
MVISPTQLMIIVRDVNVQALKFLLDSKLDKIVRSPVRPTCILFTIKAVVAMKIMILPAWTDRRRGQEGRDREAEL